MAFTSGVAVALMSAACGLAGGIEDITVVDRELPDGSTNTPRRSMAPGPGPTAMSTRSTPRPMRAATPW